ncbi:hypothetical protein E2C01_073098 [Portunus trituberculatus]|uniref:Uncharacterized protein n=1 Tax=Portunus trituberculatus TaxID=210409 RepID=A0A5B7I9N6_PORTR|nr:hypothetical protein [Portunus trituberculatus]
MNWMSVKSQTLLLQKWRSLRKWLLQHHPALKKHTHPLQRLRFPKKWMLWYYPALLHSKITQSSTPSTSTSTPSNSTSTPCTNSCYALSTMVRDLTNNMEKLKQCNDEKDAQISVLRERNRKLEDTSKAVEKRILKCFFQ